MTASSAETKPILLNVGGGSKTIPIPEYYAGFEHRLLDIDPRGEPDILTDARGLSELEPAQFDAIYCSHNLEHHYPHDVRKVLAGFRHVLKPDGFAEIRVPDLDRVMRDYVANDMDLTDTLYQAYVGPITVRDVLYGWNCEIARTGQSFYSHKTGFTPATLSKELTEAGFYQVFQRPGRSYELNVLATLAPLTEAQIKLLGLRLTDA